LNKLNKIFAAILEIPIESITPELSMENTTEWDSIRHIELLYELQETFDIKLDSYEAINMIDYNQVILILESKGVTLTAE
jgi:acyl carrier protein